MGSDQYDGFDDFISSNRGVLDGPGFDDIETLSYKAVDEGIAFVMRCHNCGSSKKLIVEWPELVALKFGLPPTEAFKGHQGIIQDPIVWRLDKKENAWAPGVSCSDCHPSTLIPLRIGLEEPEKYLRTGRARGLINGEGEKFVSQICHQRIQAMRGARQIPAQVPRRR